MAKLDELLFLAFKEGFAYSGEGANGEYDCRSDSDREEILRRQFEYWKKSTEYRDATKELSVKKF